MTSLTPAHLVKAAGAPDFVKVSHVDLSNEYDLSSKEATYISYAHALIKGASGDKWSDLEDHIRFWGVTAECARLKNKYAELNEVRELPESDYALVKEYGGQTIRKFAAFDAPSTVKSALALYDSREALPYDWKNEVATKLLAKTAQYQAELPAYLNVYLQKVAAFGAVGEIELEKAYIERDLAYPSQYREEFNKVAEVLDALMSSPELRCDYDFIKEASTIIDRCDSMAGVDIPVEGLISDALLVSKLEKIASDESTYIVKMINGKDLDVRDLKKEALDMIDEKLSKLGHAELADVVKTLPRGDADLLSRILA